MAIGYSSYNQSRILCVVEQSYTVKKRHIVTRYTNIFASFELSWVSIQAGRALITAALLSDFGAPPCA